MNDFINELTWRGMIHDMMPGTHEHLQSRITSGYIGFDPTADSLHIGNLVQIMTLVHFQRCGHKPLALVGGATGMVGDPSGKSAERNLLSEDVLRHNQQAVQKQLERFLDFSPTRPNRAEIVNNYDWFKEFRFLDFIRDVGKHITINYMLAKDAVQRRLESGLSFTEFTYQLVQGYDFYWLHTHKGCTLQMGGSDQWGNIVTGTELIRRKSDGEAFALTTPLIKKADGTKFGKTEQGNVWLDPRRTSPYRFYQYWVNASDEDAANFVKIFTEWTRAEVEALITSHQQAPHARALQLALAQDLTVRVHGRHEFEKARAASNILFGSSATADLEQLDEATLLDLFEGVPQVVITPAALRECPTVTDLLSEVTRGIVFPSKGEARRMIQNGGVSINRQRVDDGSQKPAFGLLQNRYVLVQKGKKNYYLIRVSE
jgi:tyrosyl-tRNA synthetase